MCDIPSADIYMKLRNEVVIRPIVIVCHITLLVSCTVKTIKTKRSDCIFVEDISFADDNSYHCLILKKSDETPTLINRTCKFMFSFNRFTFLVFSYHFI